MRWTRWRRKTSGVVADDEAVWSWRPDAGVKLAEAIPPATVAKKPGHRGEHGVSVKTIARGMPVDCGVPVVTTLMCFFHFAREAMGASQSTRHSLRPLIFEGSRNNSGVIAPRECGLVSTLDVIARSESDEAIQTVAAVRFWIASPRSQ
jgi:hypothetical protein